MYKNNIIISILTIFIIISSNVYASTPLKCGRLIVTADSKFIYITYPKGDIDKFKITNRTSDFIAGSLKGKMFDYDVNVWINDKRLFMNKKNSETGIIGSFIKNCSIIN